MARVLFIDITKRAVAQTRFRNQSRPRLRARRSEGANLKRTEVDAENCYLRLTDSKEVRPVGLPAWDVLENQRTDELGTFVFEGTEDGKLPLRVRGFRRSQSST